MPYILISGAALALCALLLLLGIDGRLQTFVVIGVWVAGLCLLVSVLRYLVRGR